MIMPKFKIVLHKFLRNKLNYIICLLIALCFSFSIIINSLSYSARKYYEDDIFNFVSYRVFSIVNPINRKDLINTLNNMNEIEGVFDSYGYMSPWELPEFNNYFKDNKTPNMWLLGMIGDIKIIDNSKINLSEEMEMVCPNNYLPYEKDGKPVADKKIDLTPYIGKYINFRYIDENNPQEFKIKLVGLYDNDKINKNYNMCYMNYKALEKINKEVLNLPKTNVYYQLKNIADEEKVTTKLQEMGYYPDPIVFLNRMPALESLDLLVYISYGIFFISLFIVSCIIYYNILKNKKNFLINRTYGYSFKNNLINSIFESLILFFFSFLFTIIFNLVIYNIIKRIIPIYYPSFKNITIIISPVVFLQALLFILILCFLLNLISLILNHQKSIYNNINM